ncbi:MAG: hypothetical protein OHK0039_36260 [Bacteroidia bacterium]
MRTALLCLSLLLLAACERGALLNNRPPDTRIFLDQINRSGQNRLNSVVQLHWTGEDDDGYVRGFELSLDNSTWHYTTASDSVIRFDLDPASDTTDIDFYVRAIDNLGLADPDPAYLRIPIRNTPPVARFDTINRIAAQVTALWSARWSVSDLDGSETLDSVFLRINDGPWLALRPQETFGSFIPADPAATGTQDLRLLLGPQALEYPLPLAGVRVGDDNRLYLRARDIAGAYSATDSTNVFFVAARRSDLLVIDAHGDEAPNAVYYPLLDQVYGTYDRFDLVNDLPAYWTPTFSLFLQQYDKVFWFGDDARPTSLNTQMYLEAAAVPLQEYLNQGGKLFVTAKFPSPSSYDDPQDLNRSSIFDFSPMDSLSTSGGQARMRVDSLARPLAAYAATYPPLVCATNILGADPFYPKDPNNAIYEAALLPVSGWSGPRTVCARAAFTNGKTNQVFFALELDRLAGDPAALQALFEQVLLTEFDW